MGRKSFFDAERECEKSFSNSRKWYHLFTSGKNTAMFLKDVDDFNFCVNLLAKCVLEHPELIIVAFAIMDNHIHIVISGDVQIIELFFTTYRRRLSRYLSTKYGSNIPDSFTMNLKDILDLKSLRNTIVYVNRNGYVAYPKFTPFSYPWGSGVGYFNVTEQSESLSTLTKENQRALFRGRVPFGLDSIRFTDGHITINSFCSIKFGMSLFRDAHHYFNMISKSIESYSELAVDIDDEEFLTDQELFSEVAKILNANYAGAQLTTISNAQKLDLARELRFKYRSSNGQIRRVLCISQSDINQLFPR